MMLGSCQTTDKASIRKSATVIGQIRAGVNLPELPADCRVKEMHVVVRKGAVLQSIIVRERAQLNRQNARTDRCNDFYDNTRHQYAVKN